MSTVLSPSTHQYLALPSTNVDRAVRERIKIEVGIRMVVSPSIPIGWRLRRDQCIVYDARPEYLTLFSGLPNPVVIFPFTEASHWSARTARDIRECVFRKLARIKKLIVRSGQPESKGCLDARRWICGGVLVIDDFALWCASNAVAQTCTKSPVKLKLRV
ncbi:hypothetical protein ARMGADRAFT_1082744 [Armillaria gallica]|uniref:Uncharacterized protein n=1 Tax=Armillaria gallica TaxID=47427 RepID=A0A2H3DGA8_ARMGA|nr:hypothetical protein ARMGADRAFT_1082744 [Armillaria gallica]